MNDKHKIQNDISVELAKIMAPIIREETEELKQRFYKAIEEIL